MRSTGGPANGSDGPFHPGTRSCFRSRAAAAVVFGLGLLLVASMLLAPLAQAAPPAGCTVAGEAYGAQVTAAGVLNLAKVADVILPGAPITVASISVPGALTSGTVTDSSTDASTATQASATSRSTVQSVAFLGTAITADAVTSVATSTANGTTASSSPAGTTFVNLRVNGVAQANVAAGTTVALPGVGSVVINEQLPSGNGTTGSSLTVNALHVHVTTLGVLPAGSDIIIASATSTATCNGPVATTTPTPTNTPLPTATATATNTPVATATATRGGSGGSGGGGSSGPSGTATPVLTSAEATAAAGGSGATATATPNGGTGGGNAAATPGAVSTNAPAGAGGGTGGNPTAIPSPGGGNATATPVASGGNPTATPGGGTAGAGPAASSGPNLVLNITPPPPFTPGGSGAIALTVANQGPAGAPGPIIVRDTLPPGFAYQGATGDGAACSATGQTVTCTHAGPLAAGASLGLSLQVAVDSSAAPVSTDRATVSDASGTPGAETEAPLVVQGASGAPDLAITVEPPGPFSAGGTGSIGITVTNVGTAEDPGPETVTDVLPAGFTYLGSTGGGWVCAASGQTVTCTRDGPLAVGESSQFSLQVAVDQSASTGMNRVTASPPPGGLGGGMEFLLVVVGTQTSTGDGIPSTGGVGGGAPAPPAASTDSSSDARGDETAPAGLPAAQGPGSPARLPNTGSAGVDSDRAADAAGLVAAGFLALGLMLRRRARLPSRRRDPGPTV